MRNPIRSAHLFLIMVICLCALPGRTADLLVATNTAWKYFKGRSEPSTPISAWRQLNFVDTTFTQGSTPFWYGDVFPGGTQLTDMLNQYTTLYLRRTFVV